jgi:hypothetical protein
MLLANATASDERAAKYEGEAEGVADDEWIENGSYSRILGKGLRMNAQSSRASAARSRERAAFLADGGRARYYATAVSVTTKATKIGEVVGHRPATPVAAEVEVVDEAPTFEVGQRVLVVIDYDRPPLGTIRHFEESSNGRGTLALVALDEAEPGVGRQVVRPLASLIALPSEARGTVIDPDTGEHVETTSVELLAAFGKLPEQQRLSPEGRREGGRS